MSNLLRWFTIALSVVGLLVAVYAVASAQEKAVPPPLARPASVNPFASGVAALAIVEPAGRDVAVVAPEPALVTKVHVDVGDDVEQGQPLFELDTRTLQADLLRAQAAVAAAEAEIERWHALPRAEDRPPLTARVARGQALLEDSEDRLRLEQDAAKRGANNPRDVSIARFARDAARAELAQAQADLAKLEAGGWRPDLDIAVAQRDARKAEVDALKVLTDRMIVRAPRDGMILRRTIETGEFATTSSDQPAMILGDLRQLRVRAQVDEEDIALVARLSTTPAGQASASADSQAKPAADSSAPPTALARRRGAVPTEFPLRLVRIEPFARPKSDLIGSNVERVDTRVIDVLFEVLAPAANQPGATVPLIPGQAVDVFINTAE
jgi:multidrug efflux pump subunit AcrA (membrane-fusion protein)